MLSDWLKRKRLDLGLTQKQMAEKINISRNAYSRYENGDKPNIKNINLISIYFKVSVKYLNEKL